MIKRIRYKNKLLAIIVKTNKINKKGVNFISPQNFTQQVGFINLPSKHQIRPHTHQRFKRIINKTSEVLFVKSGIIRVDFYANYKRYLFSTILKKEDLIILNQGSHGFKIIRKCKLIELKQGPYLNKLDKVRFEKVNENKIKIKK